MTRRWPVLTWRSTAAVPLAAARTLAFCFTTAVPGFLGAAPAADDAMDPAEGGAGAGAGGADGVLRGMTFPSRQVSLISGPQIPEMLFSSRAGEIMSWPRSPRRAMTMNSWYPT